MRNAARRLLLVCWLALSATAWAGSGLQGLRFERLGVEQLGLQSVILAAAQDERGVMWLGTADGLLRFDGRPGRLFAGDPADPNSLRHGAVRSLLLLPGDRLLIGTERGLDEMDLRRESVRHHVLVGETAEQAIRVQRLVPGVDGLVWLQGQHELLQFDSRRGSSRRIELPSGGRVLRAMVGDGQGGVWLVLGQELLQLDRDATLRRRLPLAGLPATFGVRSMVLDRQGRIWLGSNDGARVVDSRDGRLLDLPRRLALPSATLHAMLLDREGSLWLGYGGAGLWRLRPEGQQAEDHVHHPALPNSLGADHLAMLFEDRSGVLWASHWGRGVSLVDLRSGGFRSYRAVIGEPDSLALDAIMAVQPDGADHAWVATYGQGLNRLSLRDGRAEHLAQPAMRYQKALLRQGDRLWVGGDAGLFLLTLPQRRVVGVPLGDPGGRGEVVSALLADRRGRVWVGTAAGVHRIEGDGQRRRYRLADGLSNEVIDCLLEDREGRIWAGSKGGLQLFDAQQERFVQPLRPGRDVAYPEQLAVLSLRQDKAGTIWLGSQLGLYSLAGQLDGGWQLQSWRKLPGMPRGWIHGLELAPDDALWMASGDGLSRLDATRRQLRHYPARRGYFAGEFTQGASTVGPDGSLMYGGSGLLWFRPAELRDNATAPTVVLADLRLQNRSDLDEQHDAGSRLASLRAIGVQGPLALVQQLSIGPDEPMLGFELRAQHFYSAGLLRYAWKLEGFDRDWIYGRPGEGLATYTNLDAGNYRLLVRAANPDGQWSESQQLLALEVRPPWWQRADVRAVTVLLLFGALGLAWHLRLRALRRNEQLLQQEVVRRTAEVQAQRQQIATLSEIGRELTASLELQALQNSLFSHVGTLMPATGLGLGLVRWDERVIDFEFVINHGKAFKPYRRSLDAPEQPAARCVLAGKPLWLRELTHDSLLLDDKVREHDGQRLQMQDGSEPQAARSGLYVPLQLKGEVIGVLSVLSDQPDAFAQTHLDMLQTLATYAAVALDNAKAYRALQSAQDQLVEQRKLSALSHLVAGVAHELNTPLGNALLAASTLCDDGRRLVDALQAGRLRRSELDRFADTLAGGGVLLLRSLESAAGLVSSFKSLAVDPRGEPCQRIVLADLARQLQQAHESRLREGAHELSLAIDESLELQSRPAALRQVLEQLLDNALVHGVAGRRGGRLRLAAEQLGSDRIRLRFADDGGGIPAAMLARVFDPFFTTRLGQGSSGLGLHLAYTLVTSVLGGTITVRSEPGRGSEFEILLPRVAPQ